MSCFFGMSYLALGALSQDVEKLFWPPRTSMVRTCGQQENTIRGMLKKAVQQGRSE